LEEAIDNWASKPSAGGTWSSKAYRSPTEDQDSKREKILPSRSRRGGFSEQQTRFDCTTLTEPSDSHSGWFAIRTSDPSDRICHKKNYRRKTRR